MELSPWESKFVQLIKKFSACYYGTRRFITVFTSAHHWSLSWVRCLFSTPFHPVSLILVLVSFHICLSLSSGLFPYGFPIRILYAFSISPTPATRPAHLTLLDFITLIFGEAYKLWSSSLCSLLQPPQLPPS